MIFKRYCVTVNDNWTSMRTFWTLEGAKGFYRQHRDCANVFGWENGKWDWFCGARDLIPAAPVEPKPDTAGKPLREYLKFKYSAPSDACKCGNCQLIPIGELKQLVEEGDRLRDMVKALLPEPGEDAGPMESITLTLYVGEIREVLKVARGGGL